MASTLHWLLLFRLPGNIEREFQLLKNTLFGATGAVSTQLPPVVPLGNSAGELDPRIAESLPQRLAAPLRFDGLGISHGFHVVRVLMPETVRLWADTATRSHADDPEKPHDLYPLLFCGGVPLCCVSEVSPGELDDVQPPVGRASTLELECWRIEITAQPWWTGMEWQVLWGRRVKLRGTDPV